MIRSAPYASCCIHYVLTVALNHSQVTGIRAISRAAALPFEITDASRSEEEVKAAADKGEILVSVGQDTRLDNRFLDLRTPANQAIFRVQSAVTQVNWLVGHQACVVRASCRPCE